MGKRCKRFEASTNFLCKLFTPTHLSSTEVTCGVVWETPTHEYTRTGTNTHIHARTHARTHAHTHTHTHHTHTHAHRFTWMYMTVTLSTRPLDYPLIWLGSLAPEEIRGDEVNRGKGCAGACFTTTDRL